MTDDGKVYQYTVGLPIILDAGQDISEATDLAIQCRKPSGEEVEWEAELYGTDEVLHETVEGDLDEYGWYRLQVSMTIGDWVGLGETYSMRVYKKFT